MKWWRRAAARLLGRSRLRHDDAAFQQELESHIAMQTEDYIRQGKTPVDAARLARVKFGAVESIKEAYRDERGLPFLDVLVQDVRAACRVMRRSPGFTAIAVLSLGIGIGANAAIFSVVKGVLLRGLDYDAPGRLVAIREAIDDSRGGTMPANPLHVREWRNQCPSLVNVGAVRLSAYVLIVAGEAEQIAGARVEPEFLETLQVQPQLGRGFRSGETELGRDTVVMLSDALWRRRFGSDPAIVGHVIDLGGQHYEVVGILPPAFRLPFSGGMEPYSNLAREPDVYQPLAIEPIQLRPLGNFNYGAIARLKPGATVEAALAEINAVQAQFPRLAGQNVKLEARLMPLEDVFVGHVRTPLWTLMGAVSAVLLIVCVNLANMIIARITARNREAAIRTALGATWGRQVRQLLTETLLLSLLGGAVGVLLAVVGLELLLQAAPGDLPRLEHVRLDIGVLAFAVAISLATGVISGVLPGHLLRRDPQDVLKSASHTTTAGVRAVRTRHALISCEVALSTALLIVAGLLTVSFVRLTGVDKGFETARVLVLDLSLMHSKFLDRAERERFFDRLLDRLRDTPGVVTAAVTSALPSRGESWIDPVSVEGDTRPPFERPLPNNRGVSPDYFQTMGIRVLRGREFEEADRGRPYGILSESLAQRLWPGEDAVGKRFVSGDNTPTTVIGVVADVRSTLTKAPAMIVYYPFWSRLPFGPAVVVRTTGSPVALTSFARAAVGDVDPAVVVRSVKSLEDVVAGSMAQRRFQLVVVSAFAVSALLVASLGIYGVVAFLVASRRTELGVRVALGATPADVFRLVTGQGMIPVLFGLAGGVAVALGLGNTIRSLLFDVEPADPMTIGAVLVLLTATALVACLVPARAAAGSDPVRALRLN